ncbi:MAG: CdaR family protein [Desulfitobacteriaceae bacterium]
MSRSDDLSQMLKRNLGYKIVSVFFALLLWLWVSNHGATEQVSVDQTLTVPLVTKGLSSNLIVMSKLPSVKVRLQGYSGFNVKDLSAYVDLSGGTSGEKNYPVAMDTLPTGIKVLEVQPENLSLNLDVIQEKVLPVVVNISGSSGSGFVASDPLAKPSAVNVRGPATLLNMLEKVTVDLSVTGATDTLQITRPVLFRDKFGKPVFGPDPTVDILLASPNTIEVIIPIRPVGLASKLIPLKVTSIGTPAKGMVLRSLLPVPNSVQIWGSLDSLKGLDSISIGSVDITDLRADKAFQISVDKLSLPKGISLVDGKNLTVVAQIGSGIIQKTFTGVIVTVKNVSNGLDLDPAISPVEVSVQGMPEVLKLLTPEQLQLWVDASGLAAGNYPNSKVFWQLPPGVEMVSVPQITLNLKAHSTL